MITNMANLGLVDKAATPVTHQFTPSPANGTMARWLDREHNSGVAFGYASVIMKVREPVANNGLYRVTLDFAFPKVDVTIPAKPVLVATSRVKVEFVLPDVLNDQERKDITNMVYTALGQGLGTTLGDNIASLAIPY